MRLSFENAKLIIFLLAVIFGSGIYSFAQETVDDLSERTPQFERLYKLVASADKVVVIFDNEMSQDKVFESSKPEDLLAFRSALKLVETNGWRLSVCTNPHVLLFKNGKKIATVNNSGGLEVSTNVWSGNAELADPEIWMQWFDDRGMPQIREERNKRNEDARLDAEQEGRWYAEMPSGIETAFDEQRNRNGIPGYYDLDKITKILLKEYPDTKKRIRALFHWYGSGSANWSSGYSYEDIALSLILTYPTIDLVNALDVENSSELTLAGSAKVFTGWTFSRDRRDDIKKIPRKLIDRMLDYAVKTGDPKKIDSVKHTFGIK